MTKLSNPPSQDGTADQQHGLKSWLAAGNLLPIAVLIITCLAIYHNSLSNGFVFDDYAVIVENKHLKELSNSLPAFISRSYFKIAGGEASYRPIATLSYFLIYSFAGLNPFYYHLSSVLLHTLNVLLVYFLFYLLLDDRFKALLGGLLFACHPALTETVDCIAFNEDLLAAFFFLWALILYVKAANKGPAGAAYLLSLFFFFCGLLSKEMAITLPLIIVLYDLTFRGGNGQALSVKHIPSAVKGRWSYYVGYALICLLYIVLRFWVFTNPADGIKPNFGNFFERLFYLPNHIFSYIKLAIAPYDLTAEYVYSYPTSFFEISNLAGFVIVSGLGIFSFYIYKHSKGPFFCIWWFLISLIPVYNIIEIFNPFAERYLYIPIIGFCLLLPILIYRLFSIILNKTRAVKTVSLVVVVLISSVYATITLTRNRDWKDGLTLWSKTVKQSPGSGLAHGSLGRAYQEQGLLVDAIAEYKMAAKIMPNHFKAYYNLAVVYDRQGNSEQAIDNYKRSITINPGFVNAHYNLANLYQKMGLTDDAINHYRAVINLSPDDFEAHNNLGVAFARQGNLDQAVIEWEKVLKIDPANIGVQNNIRQAKELLQKSK